MLFLTFTGGAIQLVPDGTLLFHLALIVVMVALLNATLLKPINRILADRESRTKGRLSEAHGILADIGLKSGDYDRRLRETRAEGYKAIEKERAAQSREREEKLRLVKAEITRLVSEEKAQLDADSERAKGSLRADARETAQAISKQILKRETNH